jgi:DNA-binding MarR family transcriptional regulator
VTTPDAPGDDDLGVVEYETAMLLRRTELQVRRSNIFGALDRAAYLLLRTFDQIGPATATQIATELSLDGTTVSRQLSKMERNGWIVRQPHPKDGRSTTLRPTGLGIQMMEEVRARRRDRTDLMMAGWSPSDVHHFGDLLRRYNDSVLKYFAEPHTDEVQ